MFSEKELQPAEGAAACPESVGQRLVLCVSDDGVGLPPDLDVRRASSLGLKLVDGLSKQLEGELTIQRLAAGGAAFRIVFSGYAGGENP
jgi:two-component sensor histidine kinase